MRRSAPRWIFVGLIGLLGPALLWSTVIHTGLSGDVFWQWAAGQYMLVHHHILYTDPFSYSLAGHHWVTEEWGYEVLLALATRWIGPATYWLFSAGIATLTVLLVAGRLWARKVSVSKIALISVVVSVSLLAFLRVRPQVFSYAWFAAELWLLDAARTRPRMLWWMPALLWTWTNLHGSFLLGFVLLLLQGIYMAWPIAKGRLVTPKTRVTLRTWGLVTGVSVLASWINPHGWDIFAYATRVSFSSQISSLIAEWHSPNFHVHWIVLVILGPLTIILVTSQITAKKVEWPEFVLLGGTFVAALESVRFLPYYAIVWPVLLAELTPAFEFRKVRPLIGIPVMLAVLGYTLGHQPVVSPGQVAPSVPQRAVRYLKHQSGRVFAMYHWGGYLIANKIKVFVDGRTDFYLGSPVLPDYLAVKNLTTNPNPVWRRYRVRYVLWEPNTAVGTFLAQDSTQWQKVYASKSAVIYKLRGRWGIMTPVSTRTGG